MIITLRDLYYDHNKSEMIINLKNQHFDGEMHKAIVDVKFKFGIQCWEEIAGTCQRELEQEINQQIIWTEYDIERLLQCVNEIYCNSYNKDGKYSGIGLLEQEFETLCLHISDDELVLYITVGVSGMGPSIKLTTTKHELMRWANEIKSEFYDVNSK